MDNIGDNPEGNQLLASIIKNEISVAGRITFARFMELALYHPERGYYTSRKNVIGREGDYYTSANLHPFVGPMLARQFAEMWELLGRPAEFTISEMGAGRGLFCSDIVSHLAAEHPACFDSLSYVIHELSPTMRDAQGELLSQKEFFNKITWKDFGDPSSPQTEGVFFSNELADAFPTHQVVMTDDGLREHYVVLRDGALYMEPGPVSSPDIDNYFVKYGVQLQSGHVAEVCLEAERWMADVASRMKRGFVVTIDYGYAADKLYGPARPLGALMCYYRHTTCEDPLMRIGEQDITAHVNFSALIESGAPHGLLTAGLTNQAFFLLSLGLAQFAAAAPPERYSGQQLLNRNFAMRKLIDPDGLGRFSVLVQYKGFTEKPELRGLKFLP